VPTNPTLPASGLVSGTSTGHISHTHTVHGIINAIYKATIGTERTSAFTLAQSDSGESIRVNSASAVVVTAPSLEAGTSVEIVRMGAGAVTVSASGTTLRFPTGSSAGCRAQYSAISLLWFTTTEILVSGDLAA
jgi:hypothetical protein